MENNTQSNMVVEPNKKKNSLVIIIVIIILLALVSLVYVRKVNNTTSPQTQSEIELNQAVTSDTTMSIEDSLNSINVDDTNDADLQSIDKELENL